MLILRAETLRWVKIFHCSAHGCPTILEMSSNYSQTDERAEISCKFKSSCVHIVGDVYGQLRGKARSEWRQKNLQPHAMQLASLQAASPSRILTGNMQGLPGRAAAERLSSEQRTLLRKHKDLLPSLQALGQSAETKEFMGALSMKPPSVVLFSESMLVFAGNCVLIL